MSLIDKVLSVYTEVYQRQLTVMPYVSFVLYH